MRESGTHEYLVKNRMQRLVTWPNNRQKKTEPTSKEGLVFGKRVTHKAELTTVPKSWETGPGPTQGAKPTERFRRTPFHSSQRRVWEKRQSDCGRRRGEKLTNLKKHGGSQNLGELLYGGLMGDTHEMGQHERKNKKEGSFP